MTEIKYDEVIVELEKELRHLCTMIKQKGREILTNFEITPPQFTALQYLILEENLTIGELSNKMYLACSTITDLVDRMEKNELVKRKRDEKDRRVVRVQLTEKFENINSNFHVKIKKYFEELLSDASSEDSTIIINGLEKLKEVLQKDSKE